MKRFILIIFLILFWAAISFAGQIIPAKFMAWDANGDPCSGCKLFCYEPGTSTKKNTYSDSNLATPNTNPVVLDSRGEASTFGSGSYKFVLAPSTDSDPPTSPIWTMDNIAVAGAAVIADIDGDTQIQVEEGSDDDTLRFDTAGTEQIIIVDGKIEPTLDNDIDLGSTTKAFKNVYVDGTLTSTGAMTLSGAITTSAKITTTDEIDISARDKLLIGSDEYVAVLLSGFARRPKFSYKDGDEIYIESFVYHHDGTKEQLVYSDAQITFHFESTGSNADSEDFANEDFFYVYLDDSAIVTAGTPVIEAGQLVANTTEPTWTVAKHGWYNGADRCIFAILTDTTPAIEEFFHEGDLMIYADREIARASAILSSASSWVNVTLDNEIPKFSTKVLLQFAGLSQGTSHNEVSWRTDDQTGSIGHEALHLQAGGGTFPRESNTIPVITDDDQDIDIKSSANTTDTVELNVEGWYFPTGM